mgnify:CR=1 FL=1
MLENKTKGDLVHRADPINVRGSYFNHDEPLIFTNALVSNFCR